MLACACQKYVMHVLHVMHVMLRARAGAPLELRVVRAEAKVELEVLA